MNRIISFSLWGNKPKYNIGMRKNAALAKTIYPDWRVLVYHSKDTDRATTDELKKLGCQLIAMDHGEMSPYLWRFLVTEFPCERFIVRDADSRLNSREAQMVGEWMASDKLFHIIHDHPNHQFPVMGGMWGAVGGHIRDIRYLIKMYGPDQGYLHDQNFLKDVIFPRSQNYALKHNRETHPLKGKRFVGEVFDENDNPRVESAL